MIVEIEGHTIRVRDIKSVHLDTRHYINGREDTCCIELYDGKIFRVTENPLGMHYNIVLAMKREQP